VIDGPHFIVGLLTIFKQYHVNQFKKYLLYLTHFVKTTIHNASQQKMPAEELPVDVKITLNFLEELLRFEGSERELVKQNLGTYLFDFYK
jgi:hypothetical protein